MDTPISTTDVEVNSLLDQLKNNTKLTKQVIKEINPLKKEEAEKFVIEKAAELVEQTLETLREIKSDMTCSSPVDPELISAFASLTTATTSALEALNKLIVTDKKSATILESKRLEVESKKKELEEQSKNRILLTREELVKKLIENVVQEKAKIIDIDVVET
jgi:vacuolar-type H+-ATPase catalytic subunit A/Vma1